METHDDHDLVFGKAILRGALVAVPIALIGLTLAVWLIADVDFATAFATALLPGILLGVFGGGFVGMALISE